MSNDNTNSTIDESRIGKPYKGPTKLVWEDGRQIMRPDLEAIAQGTPGSLQQSSLYSVGKTIDDVISETDQIQFSKLKDDTARYQMVTNLITGVETNPIFKVSDPFVEGEYRELKTILRDLIDKGKVWLNPKDGNIYEMQFALREKLIKFKCQYCSKISYTPEELRLHGFSHQQARRI